MARSLASSGDTAVSLNSARPSHAKRHCPLGAASIGLLGLLTPVVLTLVGSSREDDPIVEWTSYGGNTTNSRYSTLSQINRENFKNLRIAWKWDSPDNSIIKARPGLRAWKNESTPIMADRVLYTSTSLSQVAAIDAAVGKTLWVFDPKTYEHGTPANQGFVTRGVALWDDPDGDRIFIGMGDAYLYALDARSGTPIPGFGQGGRIDLTDGLGRPVDRRFYTVTSPPVICRGTVVIGSSILDYPVVKAMPPGDVRGFDAKTGALRWIFHTIPREGESGVETWEGGSWKSTGNANVWAPMSADQELGYVYLPVSTASNDYYGGDRHGDNLFAESLVCLDASTGKRIWHHQFVHHGLWDYDLPAAPNLVDITHEGRRVRAVAQPTKQGFSFVFNRQTGEPIWPIEERPVPQSSVAGEQTSATQPFPTKPAPFERQGLTRNDLIDFTPELRADAEAIFEKYDHGPLYSPPTERGTLTLPGNAGGASWSGAVFDPETQRLYVSSVTLPYLLKLVPAPAHPLGEPGAWTPRFIGQARIMLGPRELLMVKPPYGRITSIALATGDHDWMVPLGEGPRSFPELRALNLPKLGWPLRGHLLVTRMLLIAGQEGLLRSTRPSDMRTAVIPDVYQSLDPEIKAFDKRTGELIGAVPLPRNVHGALITYMVNGKQYIVAPIGGGTEPAGLVALSLP
jgi:quinoprotein glucose dehydrogenase